MKIISYEANGGSSRDDVNYPRIKLNNLNLIVGDSGSGKTRFLNTIFDGARLGIHPNNTFVGFWDWTVEHKRKTYRWTIETGGGEGDEVKVLNETISNINSNGTEEPLVQRSNGNFLFLGKEMPKLSTRDSAISILKDEEVIEPLYSGLASIMRRSFSGSALDESSSFQIVSQKFLKKISQSKNIDDLFSLELNLNCKLYVLNKYFKKTYDTICREFINIFPFVNNLELKNAEDFGFNHPGIVPVLAMKEKKINKWIPLNNFSSGMKKVLLIITDIFTMPKDGAIYLIDEYENSLGKNAINFFPDILLEANPNNQFIITSHHPYIIGNVKVTDWIIMHRTGNSIKVKQGQELEEKYGKSKQQAFIQLINDPFFTEGIE